MKISPIGPIAISPVYADLFSHPVTKSRFKPQKDRLLVNLLEPKDRVTISPEAKELSILLQQSRPAPPDRDLQLPIGKPEQRPLPGPPITRPGPPIDPPLLIPQPIEEPISPPPSMWDDLLETIKNDPFLKALFKSFLEEIKSDPAAIAAWRAQNELIPGMKTFWEEIEKLTFSKLSPIENPLDKIMDILESINQDKMKYMLTEYKTRIPNLLQKPPGDDFTIPEDMLESIIQTIGDKLSVPVEDITIIDQKQVYWPDTSMGNPQSGGVYAQVIVPGYKITVQVGEDKHVSEFYAVLDYGGSQLEYVVGSNPLHDQPPVVAIPEQRNPESPDPMPEETKTLPIAPVAPLQNPEQSISRDQIEPHVIDRDEQ